MRDYDPLKIPGAISAVLRPRILRVGTRYRVLMGRMRSRLWRGHERDDGEEKRDKNTSAGAMAHRSGPVQGANAMVATGFLAPQGLVNRSSPPIMGRLKWMLT
jgi:hypothetical protein